MSEYWKSTPRYWCKHCKVYIRDTQFERTQHEATAKHQGNLKRFLRDLHRNHEREEKESQKAKDEIQRLSSLVSGSSAVKERPEPKRTSAAPPSRPATLEERKKQMAQLAEMGIAIPDEFRGEMAMAGEWQTVSERPVVDSRDNEPGESSALSIGVRKRKHEGEDEEEAEVKAPRKVWGSTTKEYPVGQDDEDLDALLESTKNLKGKKSVPEAEKVKTEPEEPDVPIKRESTPPPAEEAGGHPPSIKKEDSFQGVPESIPEAKDEEQETVPGVVFKKRKPKAIRK